MSNESTLGRWLKDQLPPDATITSKRFIQVGSLEMSNKVRAAFPVLPEPYHLLGCGVAGWAPPIVVDGVEVEQFSYTAWALVDGKPVFVRNDAWRDGGDTAIRVEYTQPVKDPRSGKIVPQKRLQIVRTP